MHKMNIGIEKEYAFMNFCCNTEKLKYVLASEAFFELYYHFRNDASEMAARPRIYGGHPMVELRCFNSMMSADTLIACIKNCITTSEELSSIAEFSPNLDSKSL
ncbi:MAG: hypothetical protein ACO2ZM_05590 [Francisellaceae bacterium]